MALAIGKARLVFATVVSVALGAGAGRLLYAPAGAAMVHLLHQQDDLTDSMLRTGLHERIEDTVGLLGGIARHMAREPAASGELLLDLGGAAQSWIDRMCLLPTGGAPRCVERSAAGPFHPSSSPGWEATLGEPVGAPTVSSRSMETGLTLLFRVPIEGAPGEVFATGTLRGLVDAVVAYTRVPGTGEIEVYDAAGTLFYHPNPAYLGRTWEEIEALERPGHTWTEAEETAERQAREQFWGGGSGTAQYTDQNRGGRNLLSHFGPFPAITGLSLVYSRAIDAEGAALSRYAGAATAAGGLGGLTAAALLALWLTARARRRLQARALDLARNQVRSQQELVRFTDSLSAWVFSVSADGRIRYANRAFRTFFAGRQAGDPVGQNCLEVMPETFCRTCPGADGWPAGEPVHREVCHEQRQYLVQHTPLTFPDSSEREVLHLVEDVTDLRNLRGALVESEKRGSAAVLAGSIAHEINNYLTGVYGYADLLRVTPEDVALARKVAEVVRRQLDRVRVLVGNLQRLSRPAPPQLVATDLAALYCDLAGRLATAGITKTYEVEAHWQALPPVVCDAGMIEQALTNVLLNATHAMGDVGILRLGTDPVGGEAALWVEDTGPGIPAEDLDHLFEPFFSTKGAKGTGLGLYVTRQILEAHGGRVTVASQAGVGTRFTLFLPLAAPPQRRRDQPLPEGKPVPGTTQATLPAHR